MKIRIGAAAHIVSGTVNLRRGLMNSQPADYKWREPKPEKVKGNSAPKEDRALIAICRGDHELRRMKRADISALRGVPMSRLIGWLDYRTAADVDPV